MNSHMTMLSHVTVYCYHHLGLLVNEGGGVQEVPPLDGQLRAQPELDLHAEHAPPPPHPRTPRTLVLVSWRRGDLGGVT